MAANRATSPQEEQLLTLCQKDVESFWHDELVALLKTPSIKVDVTDETGMTPLMHAAYKGNLRACEALLKHGADVNCNLHEHCYTALMFGVMSGSVAVVSLLLEAGAKPHATNKQGRTAAQTAAFVGHNACAAAVNNFFPRERVAYYSKPQGLEAVAKLPPTVIKELQLTLTATNLHPIKMMQFFFENLVLCQHHTRVSTTLEAIASKMASEMNEIMSLKAYYIYYILRTFISEGTDTYIKKCLAQQIPEGVYRERDAYLRQFLKEYPYIQNSVWKQMAATASAVPLGGPPSVLSLLHSAVRGHVGFGEVEEECATCGSVGSDLKKCFACKQVSYCNVACQKMAWEQGSHKKLCKLYRKQQSSANEDWDCATPKSSTDTSQVTLAQQKAES